MSDKLYRRLVALILVLGMLATGAHAVYAAYLHGNVSIITYIAGEE